MRATHENWIQVFKPNTALFMKRRAIQLNRSVTTFISSFISLGESTNELSIFLSLPVQPDYYKDAIHFRRIGDGPEYRLEIPRAKLDYTGTYSAIATNCHGESKAIISLQIFAKGTGVLLSIIHVNRD